jgi:copper chaperone
MAMSSRLIPIVLSAALLLACRAESRNMRVELQVTGMVCDACVQAITHELGRLEGVASVEVDLEAGKATVTYDEAEIDTAALEQAVEALGYTADPGTPTPAQP